MIQNWILSCLKWSFFSPRDRTKPGNENDWKYYKKRVFLEKKGTSERCRKFIIIIFLGIGWSLQCLSSFFSLSFLCLEQKKERIERESVKSSFLPPLSFHIASPCLILAVSILRLHFSFKKRLLLKDVREKRIDGIRETKKETIAPPSSTSPPSTYWRWCRRSSSSMVAIVVVRAPKKGGVKRREKIAKVYLREKKITIFCHFLESKKTHKVLNFYIWNYSVVSSLWPPWTLLENFKVLKFLSSIFWQNEGFIYCFTGGGGDMLRSLCNRFMAT